MPETPVPPALEARLRGLPGAVVTVSGGVDSSVLLAACARVLGPERVLAVIADSPSLARAELEDARAVARLVGVELLELRTRELEDPRYRANQGDRCYWCKQTLFLEARPLAQRLGWPLLYGENRDDLEDHRPGARAAREQGVRAPLREAVLGKEAIRALARAWRLPVADKPASPCLASRVPAGVPVTREALARIEAVESALRARGYRILRARHLAGDRLRLELGPAEQDRLDERERRILAALARSHGYAVLEIDPRGYRRGSVAHPV